MKPLTTPMIVSFFHQYEREMNICYTAGSLNAVEGMRKFPYSLVGNKAARMKLRSYQDPPKPEPEPQYENDDNNQYDNDENNQSEQPQSPHIIQVELDKIELQIENEGLQQDLLINRAKLFAAHNLMRGVLDEFLIIGQPRGTLEYMGMNSLWEEFPVDRAFYFDIDKNYRYREDTDTVELDHTARQFHAMELDDEYAKGLEVFQQYKEMLRVPPSAKMPKIENEADEKKVKMEGDESKMIIDLTETPSPKPESNVNDIEEYKMKPKQEENIDPMLADENMRERLIEQAVQFEPDPMNDNGNGDEDMIDALLFND